MPKLLTKSSCLIFENCFTFTLSHSFMDNEIVGIVSWHSLLQDNLHGRTVHTDHIPTSLYCLLACRSCTQ